MPKTTRQKIAEKKPRYPYLMSDYLIDCSKANMLYGALVRTVEDSGKITNIDAENLPEGYFLYTARDIPGKNCLKTLGIETEIFCQSEVHYKGEPVGILVGPDIQRVRQIAAEIKITILNENGKEDEKIADADEFNEEEYNKNVIQERDSENADAVEKGDKSDQAEAEKNSGQKKNELKETEVKEAFQDEKTVPAETILSERKIATGFFKDFHTDKEIDAFFTSEKFDVSDEWQFAEASSDWIEASGAFSFLDGSTVTVMTATQWPFHIQMNVASALGIDESRVEVRKTLSQIKNNNGAWRTSILAVQASIAAFLCGMPVKLLLTRHEQTYFMKTGISLDISQRTSLDAEGKIKAMQICIDGDAGYANPFSEEIANRLSIAIVNLYSPENISVVTKIKSSKNVPTSMSLETVVAGAFFAIENHIHHIADETGMLPDEIRILNICGNGESGSPFKYKNIKYSDAIHAIASKSDFHRRYTTFRMNSLKNFKDDEKLFKSLPLRGIAISCATEGAYFLGNRLAASSQKIEMTLELDGSLTVNTSIYSGSIYEIWKKIISETLQIDPALIKFTLEFEAGLKNRETLPDGLVSNVSLMTMLVKKCCAEIQKKRFHDPLPIIVKKSPPSSMFRGWNRDSFSGTPFYTASFGSAIVEVEINPDTYSHKITGIWVAVDCGEILSLKAVESTIKLCIAQELEHLSSDIEVCYPEIKIFFVQSTNPPSQISSLMHNIIPAAYTSALSQAVSSTVRSFPCGEKELFELIEAAKKETSTNRTVKVEKDRAEESSSEEEENESEKADKEIKDKSQTESQGAGEK
ncbi:MAG: xanthine dehydrogenase family protein [Treponema sp.]|nr:xanthine dehydrogenase family protein [Treponema sp.]